MTSGNEIVRQKIDSKALLTHNVLKVQKMIVKPYKPIKVWETFTKSWRRDTLCI
jgi:hypothetical protein